MVDYSKITAPFDGVVTKRYADVGALIQAGTSSSVSASAVVRFAQENVLRTMFPAVSVPSRPSHRRPSTTARRSDRDEWTFDDRTVFEAR